MLRFANQQIKERFINDVLDVICRTKEGESVSYIIQEMRYKGWVGLGSRNSDFETAVENLGFKLRRVVSDRTKRLTATYITL